LLALNGTKTVLERFVVIKESLERSVSEAKATNDGTVARINTAVSESGNREADVKILNAAKQVREKTNQLLGEMDELKAELIEITGGLNESGTPVGIEIGRAH